jgi:hypothetical protein
METTEIYKDEKMSVGDWLITLIVAAIPLVGIIMLFIWSFSSSTPASKSNWAKATLILFAVMIFLYILFFALFGASIFGYLDQDYINSNKY